MRRKARTGWIRNVTFGLIDELELQASAARSAALECNWRFGVGARPRVSWWQKVAWAVGAVKTYRWDPATREIAATCGTREHRFLHFGEHAREFDCGLYNKGAVELARSILMDVDWRWREARRWERAFAREVIARKDPGHWAITSEEVLLWLALRRAQRRADRAAREILEEGTEGEADRIGGSTGSGTRGEETGGALDRIAG